MSVFNTWRFQALDTWFFRESRPMESVGGSELVSTFPPSPRTIAGAIRHIVGNQHKVDWRQWGEWEKKNKAEGPDSYSPDATDPYRDLKQRIGGAAYYGKLEFRGAWLARERKSGEVERLYPVPGNLVIKQDDDKTDTDDQSDQSNQTTRDLKRARLVIGKPRRCNLGDHVRMPVLPPNSEGMRGADDYRVTETGLQAILSGGVCKASELVSMECLFKSEARLGIAINNKQRAVEEGLLYQTRHIRPKPWVRVEMDVKGLAENDYAEGGIVRLGGEGRGASWSVRPANDLSVISPDDQAIKKAKGIVLVLLTPADLYPGSTAPESQADKRYCPLPGFKWEDEAGVTLWKGDLHGIKLTLHCAVIGKPVREGGWDLVNNAPRAVRSLAPAGSVFYLTVDGGAEGIKNALIKLHLQQMPGEQSNAHMDKQAHALGRGLMAAGLWPANESLD